MTVAPRIDVRTPAPVDDAAEQVMVAMRDGVRLATDVYLPAARTPAAAVLIRMPYDKCGRYSFLPRTAPWFTERGFALVVQDVRGKFRSEGETVPYVHEVHDGYDTIEWITRQPWCNGTVGMFGDSYYGWTQWAAVASRHPALRAIVPRVAGADLGASRITTRPDDGIVPLYIAALFAQCWTTADEFDWEIDWSVRPLSRVFDAMFERVGARSAAFDAMLDPAPVWTPYPDGHPFDAPEVPALHCVGWFDIIGPESMRDFTTLQARGRTLQYLSADAVDHDSYALADAPIGPEHDHEADDAALARFLPGYLEPALEFLDVFLNRRGVPPARARWRPGYGDWRAAESWPPPAARRWRLYLDDAHRGTGSADGGSLTERRPETISRARWVHDPADLVPSTGAVDPYATLYAPADESPAHGRDDVVTFTSDAWPEAVELAGGVSARLVVEAQAPSSQVHVKLCDVSPGGEALQVARGQTLVTRPDSESPVSVYMGHLAHVLRPGHRLRVQIAASDFPLFLPLFGGEGSPWDAESTHASEQSLRTGGELCSFLDLDVLEDPARR